MFILRSQRAREALFMILPACLGVLGTLIIGKMGDSLEWSFGARQITTGLAGLAGVSAGFLMADHLFPDGKSGWGRAGAVWLGMLMLLPAIGLSGWMGHDASFAYLAAAIWVMASMVLFANLHLLSATQALRFAVIYQGGWLLVALPGVVWPTSAPYLFTIAVLLGLYAANFVNRYVCGSDPWAASGRGGRGEG